MCPHAPMRAPAKAGGAPSSPVGLGASLSYARIFARQSQSRRISFLVVFIQKSGLERRSKGGFQTIMSEYLDHPLSWAASVLCCLGLVWLLYSPIKKAEAVYRSTMFLPTYSVGILAWLLHGLEIKSLALIITCSIQLAVLFPLLRRAVRYRRFA